MSKQAQFQIFWHPGVIISLILSFQTSNFCKIRNSKKNSITAQLEKVFCNFFFKFFMLLQKWQSITRGFSQIWLQDK